MLGQASPALAPFGLSVYPFPVRRWDFEQAFRAAVATCPLPAELEVVDRCQVHGAVDAVLRGRGPAFIRKLDRPRLTHAGALMPWCHAWESDPEFYLAEWAGDDPLVLGAREHGQWRWTLFVNRTAPAVVNLAMYLALAPYGIGVAPLALQFARCGIRVASATLPKAIGRHYLDRHLAAGFRLTGDDPYRWFVQCRLEDAR